MTTMQVHGAYLVGRDPDTLANFYQSLLGAEPTVRVPGTWIQFGIGGFRFAVASQAEASPGAQGTVAILHVPSIDDALARATALGAQIVQQRDMGAHGRTASLRDPEGNLLQLLQKA